MGERKKTTYSVSGGVYCKNCNKCISSPKKRKNFQPETFTLCSSCDPDIDFKFGEWIPFSKSRPEDNHWVLVCSELTGVKSIACQWRGRWIFTNSCTTLVLGVFHKTSVSALCASEITHWMPLPEAKKGEVK